MPSFSSSLGYAPSLVPSLVPPLSIQLPFLLHMIALYICAFNCYTQDLIGMDKA